MTRSDSSAPRPEASSPVLPFHRVARVSLTPFNPAGESSRVRCQDQAPELSSKSDGLPIVSDCVAPCRLAGVRLLTASAGLVTLPGALGCEFQIGRAHDCHPVTNAHLVCRLMLDTT